MNSNSQGECAALSERPVLPRMQYLAFPRHLQLQTHSKCNMACSMCPHPKLGRNKDRRALRWDGFVSLINECLAAEEFQSIVLDLQNEPLLDETLVERIAYIRRHEKRRTFIGITTNGLSLTREAARDLVGAGIDRIVVSLNALDAPTFARLVPRVNFERIVENIQQVLEIPCAKEILKLSFGASRQNKRQLSDFVLHMERQGLQYRVFALHDRLKQIVGDFLQTQRDDICHLPLYSMAVLLDGTALLCCQDWMPKKKMGNVLDEGIRVVWQSREYQAIRVGILERGELPDSPCSGCDAPYVNNARIPFNYQQLSRLGVRYFPSVQSSSGVSITTADRGKHLVIVPEGTNYFLYNATTAQRVSLTTRQAHLAELLIDGCELEAAIQQAGGDGVSTGMRRDASYVRELLAKASRTESDRAHWWSRQVIVRGSGNAFDAKLIAVDGDQIVLRCDLQAGATLIRDDADPVVVSIPFVEATGVLNASAHVASYEGFEITLRLAHSDAATLANALSFEGSW